MTTPSERDREMAQECIRIDHDETVGRIAAALAQARAEGVREGLLESAPLDAIIEQARAEESAAGQRLMAELNERISQLQRDLMAARAVEREACAKVADADRDRTQQVEPVRRAVERCRTRIAAAIRARAAEGK